MKKQFLRRALLTLVGGVILSMSAWADDESATLVGKEDNSNGFWQGGLSELYEIKPDETLKVEFTSYTATDEQLGAGVNWKGHMAWVIQFWDLEQKNVFLRADGYAWQPEGYNTVDNHDWYAYTINNYPTDFRTAINGAQVVLTFKRSGAEVIICQDVTTTTNVTYHQQFAMTFGDGVSRSITAQLATEKAHIIIDNTKTTISKTEIPTYTGTLFGKLSLAGKFGQGERTDFTIKPNETLKLNFKNYSSKVYNWHNWVLELQNGDNYLDLRADKAGWGAYWTEGNCSTENYDFGSFLNDMDGADVEMTIERVGSTVKITAKQTSTNNKVFTEKYTFSNNEIASEDIIARLLTECSYLDLLPVTATISEYNWATFASDYALDFSKATEGLKAYMVTGHNDNAINKTPVEGTVPAGTGLLLYAETSGDYNIPIVGTSTTSTTGNKLVAGTGEEVGFVSEKTRYVLGLNSSAGNAGKLEFQKLVDGGAKATVPADKAYLEFDGNVNAPALSFEGDGETTGIANVNVNANSNSNSCWYDLSGRRVANPTKGLYIVNGKKVIIK